MKSTFARWFHISIGAGAALGLAGCWDETRPDEMQATLAEDAHEQTQQLPALELQQREGWHVGADAQELMLSLGSDVDVEGSERWRALETALTSVLAPTNAAHAPFYVPTLFQSLVAPGAGDLRALVTPIDTSPMRAAERRADALRSLLAQAAWPKDLAVIVDLPGPEAIAVAGALADRMDPIFTFGNWPHPHGVVPAHETLAAALFYAPLFDRVRAQRATDAPPLFVLDAARLSPYEDDGDVFDNRYAARLPTLSALQGLGIRHVLYVNADGGQELDDLNDAFVELQQQGIDVHMLAMQDFVESAIAPLDDELADAPVGSWAHDGTSYWYWAGTALSQLGFWPSTGWSYGCAHHRAPTLTMRWYGMSMAQSYVPAQRPTVFGVSGGSFGTWHTAQRPAGFGEMAIRTSRTSGHLVAMAHSARSGSFGRGGGSHGG